jgi:FSR family fosmidomycin resistance protein-like MFS transporter
MRKSGMTAACAAGHFFIDFLCAWALFRYCRPTERWAEVMLYYNFCAFALQMPLGLLADRFRQDRAPAVLGGLLVGLSCLALGKAPMALAVTAGVGNALYHVGGGVAVLHAYPKRAGPLGVFVSPGAFGIFFGTLLGKAGTDILAPSLIGLGACLVLAWVLRGEKPAPIDPFRLDAPRLALLCLFLVVCLRSLLGFLFVFPWKTGAWSVAAACAVVLGKAAGGYLSDRAGMKWASVGSLGLAVLGFLLSANPLCGVLAIFFFNMTMPITLRAAADALPGMKGFSFGLLTFALFLGFLPAWAGALSSAAGWLLALGALLSLALLLPGLRRKQ